MPADLLAVHHNSIAVTPPPPQTPLVLDVNIVHAPAITFLEGTVATGSSADVDGAAAAIGEKDKEDEYRRDIDGGAYEWVARGDGVWRQAWQGLHARAQQARDDRGRVRRGGKNMCSCAARKRRSV